MFEKLLLLHISVANGGSVFVCILKLHHDMWHNMHTVLNDSAGVNCRVNPALLPAMKLWSKVAVTPGSQPLFASSTCLWHLTSAMSAIMTGNYHSG